VDGFGHRPIKYKVRDGPLLRQRSWEITIALLQKKAYFKDKIPENAVTYFKDGIEWCAIPLLEEHLPSELPETEIYLSSDNGEGPLAHAKRWRNRFVKLSTGEIAKEFKAGFVSAVRETNTMLQWAGSCWYYLRYMSPDGEKVESIPKPKPIGRAPIFTSVGRNTPFYTCSMLVFGIYLSTTSAP
jgi:leucyl-tRNA synthetase